MQNLAAEMEYEIEHNRTSLAKLFARIDGDGSGEVACSTRACSHYVVAVSQVFHGV